MLSIQQLRIQQQQRLLIENLSLQVAAGEIVTLMGASGVGKSTLLNWLIGALSPAFTASGQCYLNQKQIDHLPTEQRQIGILFQDDLLFPHLSVGGNLAFALPAHVKGKARKQKLEAVLEQAGLSGFYPRDPSTLSGGQRARVSVLRALLAQPRALLLDEPFARLDAELRQQFRSFVFEEITKLNIPALLVTHDLADRPAQGRLLRL
ncbi:putative thiamine transport system ATP-binding protein [Thiothrix eikelboomii]|uniref:Putative thiamine transport system ATP-binding protein n=1 Tax=Thiothrix eikelboomii TaxID=92487 RepID=A0A1T4VYJ3_9GAMM|nr:ATP-binding cassette domain-containing protein [Thiothrix eikelboomii]SKA70084.1 putative thiamine transport system ATP-binding protein [Thiothrix eikelboomii]